MIHWIIGVVAVVTIVALFPRGKSFHFADLREGEIYVGEQIVAPFNFSINKTPEEYARDKEAARRSVAPVFVRLDSVAKAHIRDIQMLLDSTEVILKSGLSDSLKKVRLAEMFGTHKIVVPDEDLIFFLTGLRLPPPPQKAKGRSARRKAEAALETQTIEFSQFRQVLLSVARDLYSVGILNIPAKELPNEAQKIAIDDGKNEHVAQVTAFATVETIKSLIPEKLRGHFEIDGAVKAGFYILNTLVRPNIFFKEEETNERIKAAEALVPKARGTVLKDERIIDSHEKITREHIQKLNSLAEAIALREGDSSFWGHFIPLLGKTIFVLLSIGLLIVYLYISERKVFTDARRVLMIAISLLLILLVARLFSQFNLPESLIPVAMGSMLLTIFFNARIAFMGTVTLALLLSGLRGNEFSIIVLTLIVGSASILSVRKVRSRSWIFKSILWVTGGYFLTISALELSRYSALEKTLESFLYAGISGFLCPILTYGLMVVFEYLFDMTTDATLLELSDLNNPLLRKLALRAPGTYHHSITVGSLAEAAAEAIGANSLLARVGAYYHDIGKMDKPDYFVENQKGGKNPHDKLSPTMSYLILVSHVKRGLEIADEYNLPQEIKAFIAEHHGTSLISYFYNKALEKSEDTDVNEIDFRYPGPKPQSKETGIVLLADAVEATSRTLKDPSVSRLRGMVNAIIDDRFKNCELDESPLTLRELTLIQEAFVQILTGIFHGRIEYPDQEKLTGNEKQELETNGKDAEETGESIELTAQND